MFVTSLNQGELLDEKKKQLKRSCPIHTRKETSTDLKGLGPWICVDDVRKVQKLTVKKRLYLKQNFWSTILTVFQFFFLFCGTAVSFSWYPIMHPIYAYNQSYLGEAD